MNPLPKLTELVKTHNPLLFSRTYPGPYLLRRLSDEEIVQQQEKPEDLFSNEDTTHKGFSFPQNDPTGNFGNYKPNVFPQQERSFQNEADLLLHYACYVVVKSERNVFPNGPTIGRTSNNDIVIPLAVISKFHAWCQREGEGFYIYDARSRFGTSVDGVPAPPEGDHGLLLRPGAKLRLGDVPLLVLDATSLYHWISQKIT